MKVMVVDDQPLEGEMISYVLRRERPDVQYVGQALRAEEGIELAHDKGTDIAFLDIRMPGMDGISAIKHLRRASPSIRIVMLTAFDNFNYIRSAMRAGANDYLLKPIRSKEILNALVRWKEPMIFIGDTSKNAKENERLALLSSVGKGDTETAGHKLEKYFNLLAADCEMNLNDIKHSCTELVTDILNIHAGSESIPIGIGLYYQEYVNNNIKSKGIGDTKKCLTMFTMSCTELFQHKEIASGLIHISNAKLYIENHLHENLTMSCVANSLFLSKAYFSRLFKEKTGENFCAYLAGRRVAKARQLLCTTDLSVSEIARKIGYQEANSLSRLFRSMVQMSPSEYRTLQSQKVS